MARKKRDHIIRTIHYAGTAYYIRPTYVVAIPEFVSSEPSNSSRSSRSLANLKDNQHKGDVSAKSQTKIRNAVNWLLSAARYKRVYDRKSGKHFFFKVNFVTLTIPACDVIPQDKFIKEQIFHPWIQYARKYWGLRNYVWRAEAQANGMLHFHITTDTFLHHLDIRKVWNRLLEKNGLLSDHLKRGYDANPNSTDVHAVRKVRDLAAYLAKYFCKQEEGRRKISGRLWGSNYELSHEKKCTVYAAPEEAAQENRELFRPEIKYKSLQSQPDALGRTFEVAQLFFIKLNQWKNFARSRIKEAFDVRRFEIRNNHIPMPAEFYTIN